MAAIPLQREPERGQIKFGLDAGELSVSVVVTFDSEIKAVCGC